MPQRESSTLLLFLLPSSCMVAPIGETVNKFNFPTFFSSTIQSNNQQTLLPSVNTFSNTEMDHFSGTNPVIINDVRGKSPQIHKNWSRDSSMSSMVSSTIYHERMKLNNSMDIDSDPPVETPALSYEDKRDKENCLRKVAETTNNTRLPLPWQIMATTFLRSTFKHNLLMLMMIMSSTFSYPMILIAQRSLIYGVVPSTLFHFMALSNISLPILRTSRIP